MYANGVKRTFGAEEVPFLGRFIGYCTLKADPAKVKAIVDWPVPKNKKDFRNWLGLVNYLHKYSINFTDIARPSTDLLKNDTEWHWGKTHDDAFRAESLLHVPILVLPNFGVPF